MGTLMLTRRLVCLQLHGQLSARTSTLWAPKHAVTADLEGPEQYYVHVPAITHVQEERRRERIRAQRAAKEASLAAKVGQLSAIRRLASAQASARKAAASLQRAQTAAAVMTRHEAGALKLSDRCVTVTAGATMGSCLRGLIRSLIGQTKPSRVWFCSSK